MSTPMPLGKPYSVNSLATTNGALIKAGSTQLTAYCINNASASSRWVRFYNKGTAPTVGTDVPVLVTQVPASTSKEVSFGEGHQFPLGLGIAITGAAPVLDTTAVAAGDVQVCLNYI